MVPVMLPQIEAALAHTANERLMVKMLVSAVGVTMVVGAPATGFLVDRLGLRRLLRLALRIGGLLLLVARLRRRRAAVRALAGQPLRVPVGRRQRLPERLRDARTERRQRPRVGQHTGRAAVELHRERDHDRRGARP